VAGRAIAVAKKFGATCGPNEDCDKDEPEDKAGERAWAAEKHRLSNLRTILGSLHDEMFLLCHLDLRFFRSPFLSFPLCGWVTYE
jgi:hypothetical protein